MFIIFVISIENVQYVTVRIPHVIFCLITHPCLNTGIIMCHIFPDQWLAPLDDVILVRSLIHKIGKFVCKEHI